MVPNYPCHCHHHYKSVLSIQLYYIWVPTIRTMSHAHHFFVVSYYTSNINIANKINYCSYVWIILFSMPVLGRGWRSVCLKLSSEAVRGGLLHLAEGVSNKKTGRKYPGGICETEKTCGFCRVLKFCSVDVLLHLPVRKHEDPYMETSSRFTGSHFIRTFEVCKLGTKRYCTWSLGSSKLLHIR